MATCERKVVFDKKSLRGSRLRCLTFTAMPGDRVGCCFTELLQPFGVVDAHHHRWMPRGFMEPEEAKLGEGSIFLSQDNREKITEWWLAVRKGANTPNWDIASTCTILGKDGLMLVEAKAYAGELSAVGKKDATTLNGRKNHQQITKAIADSNQKLNAVLPDFSLSAYSHYQLCNRFAWTCKVASLGVPVILVYLGFLNADEMADRGEPFRRHDDWVDAIRSHAKGIVPGDAWNRRLEINGTPMWPIIRSVDFRLDIL